MSKFYYLDSSALVKRYVEEPGSQGVRALVVKDGWFFISKVAYAEILMTLRRKSAEGTLTDDEFSKCLDALDKDWQAFYIVEFSDEVIKTLTEQVLEYLRVLDAIHLASALWLREALAPDMVFVCSDRKLKGKVRQHSFVSLDPTEYHELESPSC